MESIEEKHQNDNNSKNEQIGENVKQPENEDFDIEQFDQMIVEKNMEEQATTIEGTNS